MTASVLVVPLYSGRWHHDAHRFLKRHRRELPAVAVFAMGPRSGDAEGWSTMPVPSSRPTEHGRFT